MRSPPGQSRCLLNACRCPNAVHHFDFTPVFVTLKFKRSTYNEEAHVWVALQGHDVRHRAATLNFPMVNPPLVSSSPFPHPRSFVSGDKPQL